MSSDLLIHYKSVNEPVKHIRLSSRSQQQRQSWKMVRFLFYIFTISTTYYICAHLTIWHIKCISVSSLFVKSLRNFEFLFCHKFTKIKDISEITASKNLFRVLVNFPDYIFPLDFWLSLSIIITDPDRPGLVMAGPDWHI